MIDTLLEHGAQLLAGSTLLLALGCVAVALSRRPLHAQRRGELCLLAVLLFVPAALLPLPRHGRELLVTLQDLVTPASQAPAVLGAADVGWDAAESAQAAGSEFADVASKPATPVGPSGDTGPFGDATRPERAAAQPLAKPSADGIPRADGFLLAQLDATRVRSALERQPLLDTHELAPHTPDALRSAATPSASSDAEHAASLLGPARPDASRSQTATSPITPPPTLADTNTAAETNTAAVDPPRALALLFIAGAGLSLVWLALGMWRLRRVLAATTEAPAWLSDWIAQTAPELRLRVLIGPEARSPFCVGLLSQTIVLPPALLHGGRRGLHSVLLHELAHARHGDGRGRLLVALALPLLWFHPLYWWLRRRVQLSAELLADDRAAADDRPAYARELLDLVQRLPDMPALPAGARPVFGAPHEFTRRIEMLLQRRDRLDTRCSVVARGAHSLFLVGLVMLSSTVFGATPASAQSADDHAAKQQIAKLHAERNELAAMVDAMRAEMEAMHATMANLKQQIELERQAQGSFASAHANLAQELRARELAEVKQHAERMRADAQNSQAVARKLAIAAEHERQMLAPEIAMLHELEAKLALERGELVAAHEHLAESKAKAEVLAQALAAHDPHNNQGQFAKRKPGFVDPYASETVHQGSAHADQGYGVSAAAPSAPRAPSAPMPDRVSAPARVSAPVHPAHPGVPSAITAPAAPALPTSVEAPVAPEAPPVPTTDLQAVLALASQSIELQTELELAKDRLHESAKLVEKQMVPKSQLRADELNLKGLEMRRKLFQRGIENEIATAQNALERAMMLLELSTKRDDDLRTLGAQHRVQELRAHLDLLSELL